MIMKSRMKTANSQSNFDKIIYLFYLFKISNMILKLFRTLTNLKTQLNLSDNSK